VNMDMKGSLKIFDFKLYIAKHFLVMCLVLCCQFIPSTVFAASPTVAVFYPEIREPFKAIFKDIIRGIESGFVGEVKQYELKKDYDSTYLKNWIQEEGIDLVIALGRRAQNATEKVAKDIPIVIGGVRTAPESNQDNLVGITLAPDPEILFGQLKKMAPDVTNITVVYSARRNGWLIEYARSAASAQGLELTALAAVDLHEAAALYRNILKLQSGATNAIWLLQDPATVDERAILPHVLEEAWNKRLVLVSNNPAHVARGVLFALYPDNVSMGATLGALALQTLENGNKGRLGMRPLQDVSIAVNVRTAEHLGLKLTKKQQSEFDLLFPSQ
jgi:putative ABC transport system substrate-binding protein